jgi:hypothetical protein
VKIDAILTRTLSLRRSQKYKDSQACHFAASKLGGYGTSQERVLFSEKSDDIQTLYRPERKWSSNIKTASLVPALTQALLSLQMIAPQAFGLNRMYSLDWDNGLMLCESLALVFFFLAACWGHERISRSTGVRRAALIAALCLAIENVRMAYGTFRGVVVIRSSSVSLA